MSKYNNPRSKRKQKARGKRQEREMCDVYNKNTSAISSGGSDLLDQAWQTPEEFVLSEGKQRFTAQETVIIKRKRGRKSNKPRVLTAAA